MGIFGNKKRGFTIAEMAVATLIVGVLAALLIPMVASQLNRSDEYRYYMTYKTLEKIAGQIVTVPTVEDHEVEGAAGAWITPKDSKYALIDSDRITFESDYDILKNKFSLAKDVIKDILDTPAYADETLDWWKDYPYIRNKYQIFTTPELFDMVAYECVCHQRCHRDASGKLTPGNCPTFQGTSMATFQGTKKDGTSKPQFYTTCPMEQEGNNTNIVDNSMTGSTYKGFRNRYLAMYSPVLSYMDLSDNFENRLFEFYKISKKNGGICDKTRNYNKWGGDPNWHHINVAHTFCSYATDLEHPENHLYGVIRPKNPEVKLGCSYDRYIGMRYRLNESLKFYMKVDVPYLKSDKIPIAPSFEIPKLKSKCTSSPYVNMKADSNDINICVCQSGYEQTVNDPTVCIPKEDHVDKLPYYSRSAEQGSTGVYGVGNYCFPGKFNMQTGECCALDKVYNSSLGKCVDAGAKPYQQSFFLNDAKALCEGIKNHWSIKNSNCDTFAMQNSGKAPSLNTDVLSAVNTGTATNVTLNSVETLTNKKGAFNSVDPNIVFSNGVRLWILGDRAGSIPGLTYIPSGIKSTQNMCVKVDLDAGAVVKDAESLSNLKTKCNSAALKNKGAYFCSNDRVCYAFNHEKGSAATDLDARSCCLSTLTAPISGQSSAAISGFTVYADINGIKNGTGTLWDDVFPFYITSTGYVIPGYPLDASKDAEADNPLTTVYRGGNDYSYLPVDVYYHELDNIHSTKKRVLVSSNVSFARGACVAGLVQNNSPYCKNIFDTTKAQYTAVYDEERSKCVVPGRKCYVTVRNKTKIF